MDIIIPNQATSKEDIVRFLFNMVRIMEALNYRPDGMSDRMCDYYNNDLGCPYCLANIFIDLLNLPTDKARSFFQAAIDNGMLIDMGHDDNEEYVLNYFCQSLNEITIYQGSDSSKYTTAKLKNDSTI